MTDRSTATRLRLDGVSRRYGAVEALRDVDLTVESPGIHALVGPNGSGKSTLLALALGLARPTSGTVERPPNPGVGFQTPSYYPDLSVDENLATFAAMGDADADWIATLRSDLGLHPVRSRVAGDLSGGYRRLLDVALAFVRQPDFVVLDEPLDELDAAARERVTGFVDDYADDRPVLVSTHHAEAWPAVDRLVVLVDGEVRYDEPLDGTEDYERIYAGTVE